MSKVPIIHLSYLELQRRKERSNFQNYLFVILFVNIINRCQFWRVDIFQAYFHLGRINRKDQGDKRIIEYLTRHVSLDGGNCFRNFLTRFPRRNHGVPVRLSFSSTLNLYSPCRLCRQKVMLLTQVSMTRTFNDYLSNLQIQMIYAAYIQYNVTQKRPMLHALNLFPPFFCCLMFLGFPSGKLHFYF